MAESAFDRDAYLASRQTNWDRVAAGYRRWLPVMVDQTRPLSDHMVDLAKLQAGSTALDLATGAGEPALTAARRVGPTGHVVATDIASAMLTLTRERAAELGLANVELAAYDIEAAPAHPAIAGRQFDGVLSRWGIMFALDIMGALERILTLLKPGGRFVAAVWGPPDRVPWQSLVGPALGATLGLPPPPPELPSPFRLAEPKHLGAMLKAAGFIEVDVQPFNLTITHASADEFARFHREAGVGAFLAPVIEAQPADRQAAFWQAVADAAALFQTEAGLRFENLVYLAKGRRT